MNSPIEIFFSYAHEDEALMNDVRRQLVVYERNGQIIKWHDRMIPPGGEWKKHIDQRLNSSHPQVELESLQKGFDPMRMPGE